MAELLVRVVDKQKSGDPYQDRHLSERGCVICIMPDGHVWSKREQSNPEWIIIKIPGINPNHISHFTAKQIGYGNSESEKINLVLRRWQYKLNIDLLQTMFADSTIRQEFKKNPSKSLHRLLYELKETLPDIEDPLFFGLPKTNKKVFG